MPASDDFFEPRLLKILALLPLLHERRPRSVVELVCPAPVGMLVRGVDFACLLFYLACHRILDLDFHIIVIRKLRRSLRELADGISSLLCQDTLLTFIRCIPDAGTFNDLNTSSGHSRVSSGVSCVSSVAL